MNTLKTILYKFDFYGQAVASLNVNGQSTHHTMIGGSVGLIVWVLVSVFLGQRSEQMVNRKNTAREEVTQSIDLMANDSPRVNLKDYQYSVGLGAVGMNYGYRVDEKT